MTCLAPGETTVKTLLDTLANSGQPKLWDLTPPDARQMVRLFSEMLEGKEPTGAIEHRSHMPERL